MLQNKHKEIEHNKKIIEEAEFFWGWDTPAGKLRAQRRARMITDEIRKNRFSELLEIGCGTGIFTEFFCKEDFRVSGLDISPELLKKAKIKCADAKSLNLSAADAERLPFRDDTFDAVVGVCVLHHINVLPVLKEIKRVLKKTGVILFSEPNMMNPQLMLQKNIKPIRRLSILGETEDETAFFRWQMKEILQELGFLEITVTPFDFLHPWTPKPLIPLVKKIGLSLEKLPVFREIAGSLFICATK